MSLFHKDKRGVKLMAVARVAREERAIEHSRQTEVDVLSSRALQVVGDSKNCTNDVDWCDFPPVSFALGGGSPSSQVIPSC